MKRALLLLLVAVLLIPVSSLAADYPERNINVIIQYSPGGPTDMSVRGLLEVAGKKLPSGVSFVPVNMTGGAGIIGMTATANSKPDGYNLGVIAVDLLMHHYFGRTELSLDNFVPLAATMADPYGLVINATAEYQTVDEFIAYAKEHPEEVIVGNTGAGGAPHLAAIAFQNQFGLKFTNVTYDGSADCIAALAGNHINATFTQVSPAKAQMEAGALKMIGVIADERMPSFPDVPTVKETQEIDFSMRGWVVVCAPVGTAPEHVEYLTNLFAEAAKTQEYKDIIRSLGMEPVELSGESLNAMLASDSLFYKDLIADIELE